LITRKFHRKSWFTKACEFMEDCVKTVKDFFTPMQAWQYQLAAA